MLDRCAMLFNMKLQAFSKACVPKCSAFCRFHNVSFSFSRSALSNRSLYCGTAHTSKHTEQHCGCNCRDGHSCEFQRCLLIQIADHRGSWSCSSVTVKQHGFSLLSVGDDRAHFDHDDVSSVAAETLFFFYTGNMSRLR